MKRALLILAFLGIALSLSAQLGVKVGATYNRFGGVSDVDYLANKSRTGFQAGVLYKLHLPLLGLAIQPEILYQQSKTDYTPVQGGVIEVERITQKSLLVPLHFQFGLDLVMLRPFIQISPYLKYMLGKSKFFSNSYTTNRLNYGLALGGGIDIWRFQFSASYYWDFKSACHSIVNYSAGKAPFSQAKNKGVQLALAYFF